MQFISVLEVVIKCTVVMILYVCFVSSQKVDGFHSVDHAAMVIALFS